MAEIKLQTKISSFQDVQKSLQEIEKRLNELLLSVNKESETEVSDKDGKTGDIQVTQNVDKSYNFEVRTQDGWKTPVLGESAIKFTDKPSSFSQKIDKSIDDIESDDTSTGSTKAKKNIYDEKADKFILARPDYDSGWLQDASDDAAITVEHSLDTITFSLMDLQISNASTGANATWVNAITGNEVKDGYVVQVKDSNNIFVGTGSAGPPTLDCAGTTWEGVSSHFRLRLWK
jgi:hypothetical protein